MKTIATIVALCAVAALGLGTAGVRPALGGHDPVTICHKPGTPAEHTIVVDDSSIVQAHLHHGDTLGPCVEPPPTTTTSTSTTPGCDQYGGCTTTETITTETTTTTDKPPFVCPNGEPPIHGKDGAPGNDSCNPCSPPVNLEKCPPAESTTSSTTTESTSTETTTETTTTTPPPAIVPPVVSQGKPPKHHKPTKVTADSAKSTKHSKPPACPPGKPYAGVCGVQGSG